MKSFNSDDLTPWQEMYLMLVAYFEPEGLDKEALFLAACDHLVNLLGPFKFTGGVCTDCPTESNNFLQFEEVVSDQLAHDKLWKILSNRSPFEYFIEQSRKVPKDVWGGAPGSARWSEVHLTDFRFKYWPIGPYVALTIEINASKLEPVPMDNHQPFIESFFKLAAATGKCWYGAVDIANATDAAGGSYFSLRGGGSWHRTVEEADWFETGIADKRPRGVYWGNYFGPEILARLDPNNDLAERFLKIKSSPFGKQRHRAVRIDGGGGGGGDGGDGLFLSMAQWPREMYKFITFSQYIGGLEVLSTFLKNEFRRTNLL